ncbi:Ankyrin repeat and SOCS box protein 3 like protein [Argiope bruennichi]|uniref:Ankyrin repeat and SOCS box protein 3 like protein n=1 Tax=Argiope bruennichi TaxID=94029 RepID=A0A8T0E4U1_ARGBR|nr:Ankyrin repeat and SOCS box protein 3 like protein [Argiope bruennichi]
MNFTEPWCDTCSTVGYAARLGNVDLLENLINEKKPVDVADNRGWRPLHEAAAASPTIDCLEMLLKYGGTDVNWTTHEGESALLLACKRRQGTEADAYVNLLLRYGADPNILDNEEDSPLLEAVRNANKYVVEQLITAGANVNATDCSKWSPLHEAATKQDPTILHLLLNSNAIINIQDECGMTPIFTAAQHGCESCLKELLSVAKERNQENVVNIGAEDWATPLMIAAQRGFVNCVKILIDYGADPDLKTSDNATALHLAVQGDNKACLEILLEKMSLEPLIRAFHPSTYEDIDMICPVHLAVEWGSTSNAQESILAILVHFCDNNQNEVVVHHFASLKMESCNSEAVFKAVVNTIEDNNIPWANLISVLMDSCNTMRGKKKGVETRLRSNKAPHLLDIDVKGSLENSLTAGFSPDSLYTISDLALSRMIAYQPKLETAVSYAAFKSDKTSVSILLAAGASCNPPVPESCHSPLLKNGCTDTVLAYILSEAALAVTSELFRISSTSLLHPEPNVFNIFIESGSNVNYQRHNGASNEVFLYSLLTSFTYLKLLLFYGCDPNLCFQNESEVLFFIRCAGYFLRRESISKSEFFKLMLRFLLNSKKVQYAFLELNNLFAGDVGDILEELNRPSSLKHICSVRLRQHLYSIHGVKLPHVIKHLCLPLVIEEYMICEDLKFPPG